MDGWRWSDLAYVQYVRSVLLLLKLINFSSPLSVASACLITLKVDRGCKSGGGEEFAGNN